MTDPTETDLPLELGTLPLRKIGIGRVFIFGGPAGLCVAIFVSLWVSYLHVRATVVIQAETQWRPGESLAIRAQLLPEQPRPLEHTHGRFWVEQGDLSVTLAEPESSAKPGLVQATAQIPDALRLGPAQLHVRIVADGFEDRHEVVPIEVVTRRPSRPSEPIVTGSSLQHGDDTEAHPPGARIDVLVAGRWLTQFVNTIYVRVLTPKGRPYRGPVEVWLASGEFMGVKGRLDGPAHLVTGSTDALGLLKLEGALMTDVARFEVRVLAPNDPKTVLHRRRIRLVSFAGGVRVDSPITYHAPGHVELDARGHSFSRKRPIFVDVHGPDGAWIGTFDPPFMGEKPPRRFAADIDRPGILQLEGYHFTHAPGESTAIHRIQLAASGPSERASLDPLLQWQRAAVDLPRTDRHYDAGIEREYLDWIAAADLGPAEIEVARAYLLATRPPAVFGPPTAWRSRDRDLAELDAIKTRWTRVLRWFLLGGGALFLLAMTITMVRTHAAAAARTLEAAAGAGAGTVGNDEFRRAVRTARRDALGRGLTLVAVMAAGLGLTVYMLENLLWVF